MFSEDETRPELWLVKVPRSLGSLPLEGAKFKLPNEGDECGTVISKLEGGLELRLGDISEHKRLRALFLDEWLQEEVQPAGRGCAKSKKLRLAGPFSGQLNLVRRNAEAGEILKLGDNKPLKKDVKETQEVFVEPYRGLEQKTGLRVRSLLPGTKVKCKKWNRKFKSPSMKKEKNSRRVGKKQKDHKKKKKT